MEVLELAVEMVQVLAAVWPEDRRVCSVALGERQEEAVVALANRFPVVDGFELLPGVLPGSFPAFAIGWIRRPADGARAGSWRRAG
jgi:hypothetical protein